MTGCVPHPLLQLKKNLFLFINTRRAKSASQGKISSRRVKNKQQIPLILKQKRKLKKWYNILRELNLLCQNILIKYPINIFSLPFLKVFPSTFRTSSVVLLIGTNYVICTCLKLSTKKLPANPEKLLCKQNKKEWPRSVVYLPKIPTTAKCLSTLYLAFWSAAAFPKEGEQKTLGLSVIFRVFSSFFVYSNYLAWNITTPVEIFFKEILRTVHSAWPDVKLRFCPWLLLFKYWTGGPDPSSSLCLYYVYL